MIQEEANLQQEDSKDYNNQDPGVTITKMKQEQTLEEFALHNFDAYDEVQLQPMSEKLLIESLNDHSNHEEMERIQQERQVKEHNLAQSIIQDIVKKPQMLGYKWFLSKIFNQIKPVKRLIFDWIINMNQEIEKANSILRDQFYDMRTQQNDGELRHIIKESNRMENRYYFKRKRAELEEMQSVEDQQQDQDNAPTSKIDQASTAEGNQNLQSLHKLVPTELQAQRANSMPVVMDQRDSQNTLPRAASDGEKAAEPAANYSQTDPVFNQDDTTITNTRKKPDSFFDNFSTSCKIPSFYRDKNQADLQFENNHFNSHSQTMRADSRSFRGVRGFPSRYQKYSENYENWSGSGYQRTSNYRYSRVVNDSYVESRGDEYGRSRNYQILQNKPFQKMTHPSMYQDLKYNRRNFEPYNGMRYQSSYYNNSTGYVMNRKFPNSSVYIRT
ncbi:UNKNOWN [Stylonychia lemnae]|uniref:Uncharacterized protein n=1 Tax=Stylonychia lemnae TaxID=5949 RepID=A0A078A7T1_STYLE|nr:UNKNOWN [Stylonychia lemnae]|eukprot:CDW77891.1 UNKNOWN [Stylonychia lemnae]